MNILIISDSHGRGEYVEEAIRRVRPDAILFAGDGLRDFSHMKLPCPLYAVKGNCDWAIGDPYIAQYEDEALVTLGGIRILLMHGHRYGVKSTLTPAIARAVSCGADVLVYGHTHEAAELHLRPGETLSGLSVPSALTVFNPGSIGDYGHSFGTLTVKDGQMLFGMGEI